MFIGRDAEMYAIKTALETERIVVICGAPGIGKSRLVTEYARAHASSYPGGLLFVPCEQHPPIELSRLLRDADRAVYPDEKIEDQCRRALRGVGADGRALLIYDAVADEAMLRDWLPYDGRDWHLLVTSTSASWETAWCVIELKSLDSDAAVGLVASILGAGPATERLAAQLVANAGGVTLQLRDAAKAARDAIRRGRSVDDVLSEIADATVSRFESARKLLSPEAQVMMQVASSFVTPQIWDKLVRELQSGPLYTGQDLASHDIYFVDALAAGLARLAGDGAVYEKSGMPRFEHKLSDSCSNERFETHVTRFVHAADLRATGALDHIGQLRSALVADRERLQEAAKAAKAQLPKLDAIRVRRDTLPAILERYLRDCCVSVLVSYEEMIGQLRMEAPILVRNKALTSLGGFDRTIKAHFIKTAVPEEVAAIYTDIIKQYQERWCNNAKDKPGIRQVLEPTIERMLDEIVDEVAAIQTELRSLHFELTGWSPVVPRDAKADVAGRLLGIVGGIFLHDVGVIAGGANGMRGLAGTLAGYVAGATLAAILGLAFPVALPVVIIAGLVGAIFIGRAGLEDRIWRATCEKADPVLAQLPGEVRPTIHRETRKLFKRLEEAIMADVNAIIDKVDLALRHGLELNQLDQDAKGQSLRELDKAEAQIKDHKKQLANVIVLARQAGGQQRAGV